MPRILDTVSTLNSFVRTLLAVVVVVGLSVAGWFVYWAFNGDDLALREKDKALAAAESRLEKTERLLTERENELRQQHEQLKEQQQRIVSQDETITKHAAQIEELTHDLEEKQRQVQKLTVAVRLLKIDHRLARIRVLEQGKNSRTDRLSTTFEFVEVNEEDRPIDQARQFTLDGDMVYIDSWVAKFDDEFVQTGDPLRGTSICLFNRIFGEYREPSQGFRLDELGTRPNAYARGGGMSDLEQSIWENFWEIANNPKKAQQLGIRAAHGQAVSTRLREGKAYRVLLRSSGDLSITPMERPVEVEERPAA
jgi:TolA-binding protein